MLLSISVWSLAYATEPLYDLQSWVRAEVTPDRSAFGALWSDGRILNRARLGLGIVEGPLEVYVQVQDVRRWGSAVDPTTGLSGTLTDFSADGFDLHQGFARLGRYADAGLDVTIGRQEVSWHNERLIGTVGWTPQARSLDGIRLRGRSRGVEGELLYAMLLDGPPPETPDASTPRDTHLIGGFIGMRGEVGSADLLAIGIHDLSGANTALTTGGNAKGSRGPIGGEAEAFVQLGSRAAQPVVAALLAARVHSGDLLGPAKLFVGTDWVSGDADPTDATDHTFDTLLATNHKFYGHMDYYLNLPVHTQGRGLVDVYVGTSVASSTLGSVTLATHLFRASVGTEAALHGAEIDLDGRLKLGPHAKLLGGGGIYLPGRYWEGSDPALFSYLQLVASLASPR